MMLSASPNSLARSSLEEMLDSLRRRDETEKPKDLPPALPARPPSRARLPSARKSLPTDFKVGEEKNGAENGRKRSDLEAKEEKGVELKKNSFGNKKMKIEQEDMDSPYSDGVSSKKWGKSDPVEWQDHLGYFVKKNLLVWCRLTNGKWEAGKIQSTSGDEALVSLCTGNLVKVSIGELLPANPDILEGVDDLIQLSYLNEPSFLHNLRLRYSRNMIYSKAGPVLVAVNPFKDVQIYENRFATGYRDKMMDSPHVYGVANSAYSEMMGDEVNQSIIISGESGAGKTETAKYAMQYLAALGGGSGAIEQEIIQSNCVLEAFGNAKTSRNANSSRFGKLIGVHFSSLGKICGARIQTFLLEKSRVVQLVAGERSYHIFYQLCAGASAVLKDKLNLKIASQYNYLNQSECLAIEGVDDAQNFHRLMEALNIVKIQKEDIDRTFAMLAVVLWLGNISFEVIDNENHVEVVADEALATTARLMGCSSEELMLALSTHKVQASNDSITKKLTLRQAIDNRDALAKLIYENLFDWLLEQINITLQADKWYSGRTINILDIYGFESFKKNSFEQFCINYANERLQQHFNRHLLKLQQEEYESDGIDWTRIEFKDNQDCLDLIEKRSSGLLSLLDAESNSSKATDLTFANKLKQHLSVNSRFKGERGRAFGIRHYAGEVLYDTNGFLEKNRDPLHSNLVQLLSSCSCKLLQLFASQMLNLSHITDTSIQPGALDYQKRGVGMKFKGQLFQLMHQLENTMPHFVHCIRPNSKQLPGIYEEDLVLQQLRGCGILEVVRISKSGYSTRITHQEFAERYGFLLSGACVSQDPLSKSVAILQQFNFPAEMYQIGYTKVYLRSGQVAALEDKRRQCLWGTLEIQKCFRGYLARCHFYELKNGVSPSPLQGKNTVRKHPTAEKSIKAIFTQVPDKKLPAIICLQSVIRGWLVRNRVNSMHNSKQLNLVSTKPKRRPGRRSSDEKDITQEQLEALPSNVTELQKRVLKSEATLSQKEEENAALREQLQQFEARWSEYDAKMKSMEDVWQKQMASLQMSLAAARKSLAPDNHAGREANGSLTVVNSLTKEFDQRRQTFDDDVKALVEVKAAPHPPSNNVNHHPDEDLRKLKLRFETWKKDYKSRLREAKARLQKNGDGDKSRRKWWGKISARVS